MVTMHEECSSKQSNRGNIDVRTQATYMLAGEVGARFIRLIEQLRGRHVVEAASTCGMLESIGMISTGPDEICRTRLEILHNDARQCKANNMKTLAFCVRN
jgi:hypothetical protein